MKKKISLICLCSIFLLGICGCNNNENNNGNELIRVLKCNVLNNIKYSFDNYFITNDNDLYVLNINQLYSNNENCKKINNDEKIIKLMSAREKANNYYKYFVLDDKGNIYNINNNELTLYTDIKNENYDVPVFETFQDDNIVSQYLYFALKKDGNLYWYEEIFQRQDKNKLVLLKKYDNEIILEYSLINIQQGYIGYIKTDKAFYTTKAINQEQCEKYADVECQYEIVKNEKLTDIYDDISIYRLDSTYITKDGKQYAIYE